MPSLCVHRLISIGVIARGMQFERSNLKEFLYETNSYFAVRRSTNDDTNNPNSVQSMTRQIWETLYLTVRDRWILSLIELRNYEMDK